MKNKIQSHPLEGKLQKVVDRLEHLIAVEMCKGGATQDEIAASMKVSKGKVNGLVKGVKLQK